MMKKYALTCPDPDCNAEWQHEADPAILKDGGDLIECPTCKEPWEWEYHPEADTLVLLLDDEVEDDDSEDDDEEEDDDDDLEDLEDDEESEDDFEHKDTA